MSSSFDTTQWTLVLQAACNQTPAGVSALNQLCRRYWKPLHGYACSRGYSPTDAEDVTQSFFQQLLARGMHAQADPERGRFRTFMLHAMRNFIANDRRDASRLKRGGPEALHLDLDDASHERELTTSETPETIYEQKWAQAVIAAAVERLRLEYEQAGHAARFAVMRPLLSVRNDGDTEAMAAGLGVSVANFRKLLHHFRHRFGDLVREEVRHLVTDPADVDDEIAHLMRALAG